MTRHFRRGGDDALTHKAFHEEAERREAPRVPDGRRTLAPRTIWAAGGAVILIVGVAVGVWGPIRSSPKPPPPAQPSAGDRAAPASLVRAADAVGFHPNTEPGVGRFLDRPASAAPAPSNANLLPVGSAAPGFTLETPTGKNVSLSDYRGKAVLLEFFATWCPHCAVETPHLQNLFASLPKARYAWLLVNSDGERAPDVFAFHRYFGLTAPALLDPSIQPGDFHHQGAAGLVTIKYNVRFIPTLYVIDPHGKIAWRSDGEQPDALLRQELVQAAG